MIAPISPVDGNNPSFTLGTVDPATAILTDYRVIAASNQTGVDTKWSEEYDFDRTYQLPAFTATTVGNLIAGFKADPSAQSAASQDCRCAPRFRGATRPAADSRRRRSRRAFASARSSIRAARPADPPRTKLIVQPKQVEDEEGHGVAAGRSFERRSEVPA